MLLLLALAWGSISLIIRQLEIAGPPVAPWPTFHIGRRLALRGLGLMFAAIFLSVYHEAPLLIGHKVHRCASLLAPTAALLQGITPAAALLLKRCPASWSLLCLMPSAAWTQSDVGILCLCALGGMISLALVMGKGHGWPAVLSLAWLYRSVASVGGLWFSYAWEPQLLETTVTVALCLCPLWPLGQAAESNPLSQTTGRWAVTLLVFRVMAAAGKLKMQADPCWQQYNCFERHFENMPMPNPLSHTAHRLPSVVLSFMQWLAIDVAEVWGPGLLLLELLVWPLLFGCAWIGWSAAPTTQKSGAGLGVRNGAQWLFGAIQSVVSIVRSIGAGLPIVLMVGIMGTGDLDAS